MEIKIMPEDPKSNDSIKLMDELSSILENITGNDGKSSFNPDDVSVPKSLFVIARDSNNSPIGCGAIRPINDNIAEIKRMYTRKSNCGIGRKLLVFLENEAKKYGYKIIRLETRKININAVKFYTNNGYKIIQNYGKYINNNMAVCFEKQI
jgi:hypothetical protein